MYITFTYQVLISCPGDVADKFMPAIKEAVSTINRSLIDNEIIFEGAFGFRVKTEVLYWRDNGTGEILTGMSGQDVLNEQLVNNADGVIGIFYSKLGTKTDNYPSGTVEEIEKTLARGKHAAIIPIQDELMPIGLLGDGKEYARLQEYIKTMQQSHRGLIMCCPPERLNETIKQQMNIILRKSLKQISPDEQKFKTQNLLDISKIK